MPSRFVRVRHELKLDITVMHGHSPGSALLANAEVDSMGGVVNCEVGLDTKTSPRRAAIEKAQAELRQEYDVREERRRELDFLEKGGNPLDFKFGHAASISIQSTSLTDQLAEQYVTSEAKGSFALAASPHGDSVESSGRPGGSVGREPNTADNLLLFDGENSNHNSGRNIKCTGKRGRVAAMEQSSDGCHNAKEPEDSVIFRLGVRSQAYARRNRSRPNRDSSHVVSTDLNAGGNRPLVSLSSLPKQKDAKSLLLEMQPEDQAISSVSNSKPTSPNINDGSKTLAADGHMDVDAEETHGVCKDISKDGFAESIKQVKSDEKLPLNGQNDQHSHAVVERVPNEASNSISDFAAEGKASPTGFSAPLEPTERGKDVCNTERVNGFSLPDKDVVGSPGKDLSRKAHFVDTLIEVPGVDIIDTGHAPANIGSTMNENARHDHNLLVSMENGISEGYTKEQAILAEVNYESVNNDRVGNSELIAVDVHMSGNEESKSTLTMGGSAVQVKDEVELCAGRTNIKQDMKSLGGIEREKCNGDVNLKPEIELDNLLPDGSNSNDKDLAVADSLVSPTCGPTSTPLLRKVITDTSELQNCAVSSSKLVKKAQEDSILREARIIEANHKRAGELAIPSISSEQRKKCHWDFVLQEMAWMANDFMQERIWKTTAAAKLCYGIASDGLSIFRDRNMCRRQKYVSRTLAKAVMNFWHSAEVYWTNGEVATGTDKECSSYLSRSGLTNDAEVDKSQVNNHTQAEDSGRVFRPVHHYAARFLKHMSTLPDHPVLAEAPATPDRIFDAGILEISWEDQLSEENLFYKAPSGAMKAYRKSVESRWIHFKTTGNAVYQEDREASVCDSVADGPQDSVYEEDEGETGTYLSPGVFEGSLPSKFTHKNRKSLQHKSYGANLYDVGPDIAYDPCLESKSRNQPLTFTGKRLPSTLNVGSIPTKRVRTASSRRVCPSAGMSGSLHATPKTDVSSGDTNSFQDDQSSLHGGSQSKKNIEVESTLDYERQLPFDGCDISTKSKKKKKPKHSGYKSSSNLIDSGVLVVPGKVTLYEQRMQVDSTVKLDQREHFKKRLEQQYESNGNNALYAPHPAKKPKLLSKQTETSPETIMPITGSLPSPVASQMSNMSNSNKLIRIVANRDRGKKNKTSKMASGQSGTGSPWSPFEDQALVVLVHDMGPNWELISDAINSTLLFKYIYRRPKECKERHKFLMDKSAGDGADSAEDSGSSQPYPSTLPGIPKGSARQLFQRLQGPLEEDTLKAHFEKIILLGQQLHSRRIQIDSGERTPAHPSHVIALSQASPNNLAGGVLSPHDLCDATASSQDVLPIGFQGSQANGIHQGPMAPVLATSNSSTMLPGSPGMVLGTSLPSSSTSLNVASRDTQSQRYGIPRPASLPVDDQQRMQQYSQMLSGRNIQQSGVSMPGALPVGVDRGVRMLSGGNGMGMMCGMNRGMAIPRPGFQGISSPGMLNMVSSGTMLSGNGVSMQNPVNVHPAAVSGPGNSTLRPRDSLQMLRPGQNTEEHRQVMMQELQMQVSQGNGQPVSPFTGISTSFSNTTAPASLQTFPVQQQTHQMAQQPHVLGNPHHPPIQGTNHSSPQQQAYAIRFAKERQLQQRMMPQNQHPFSASSAISPVQNGSQIQQQSQSSSPATPLPSSQAQHKQQHLSRNPQLGSGVPNQIVKQRQRQPLQQQQQQQPPLRHQQQQRQQTQQQGKVMKGLGRGNMLMSLPGDASHVNGLGPTHKGQLSEKHLMQQGQGFYSGSPGLNPSLPQTSSQQKMYPRPVPQSSKQMPPIPSHTDSTSQGSAQASSTHTSLASQQPPAVSSVPPGSQQPQRQISQSPQTMPRMMLQQNRQLNSDGRRQTIADPVQVNQMIPIASIAQCADSVGSAPVVSPAAQWKPDQSNEVNTPPSTAHLASSPQENSVGTETLMPPPSQGLVQRQLSEGAVSAHEHETGGVWQQQQHTHQQQQPQQPQLQQQHQHQHQHQHRQTAHGDIFVRPSNSGPG